MGKLLRQSTPINVPQKIENFIHLRISEKVTKSALKYQVSERIQQLAKHNEFSKDFTPPNLKFWVVKRSALKVSLALKFLYIIYKTGIINSNIKCSDTMS